MPLLADSLRNLTSYMVVAAITIMALYYGQDILVPISLATILAFILAPIVNALRRANVPHALSVTISVLSAVTVAGLAIYAFSNQLLTLAENLDSYKANMVEKVRSVTSDTGGSSLRRAAASIEQLQRDIMQEVGSDTPEQGTSVAPTRVSTDSMAALKDFIAAVGAPIGKALLTVLFAFFLLLQHADLRDRIIRVAGTNNMSNATAAISEAGSRLSKLFLAQATINSAFGIVVGCALWLIGVPNPALWGIAAAVLRFVPFFGSFLGAIPPLLLAAGVEPGWSMFLMTLTLFAVGEPFMGQVVEPLVLGRRVGLSPFAIVVALSLWTLLWGPIGLILAVPITLAVVVLGRYVPGLEFMSVMLGDEDPLTPEQRFYNRLLSKDASSAIAEVEEESEESSIITVTDEMILPALQIASTDYKLDRLDTKHLSDMHETIELVSEAFADAGPLNGVRKDSTQATSIVVIPARGPVDKMAADFLTSLLNSHTPYAVRTTSANGLTAVADAKASLGGDDNKPAVVVVTTGAGDGAQLRLIVNRAASTFVDNPIYIAGLGANMRDGGAGTLQREVLNGHWTTVTQLVQRLRSHHPETEKGTTAPGGNKSKEQAPVA